MREASKMARFELLVVPQMRSAYNLARWLTRNDHDAEDAVQEAYLRAYRFFDDFRGGDARAWLLAIVRNTCYSWLRQNRRTELVVEDAAREFADTQANPEVLQMKKADEQTLRAALEALPVEFREAIVLRELEGLSYKEIGAVTGVPVGTVMSRLARARERLVRVVGGQAARGGAA